MAWVDRLPAGGVDEVLADLDRALEGTAVAHRALQFADAQAAYEVQETMVARGFQPKAAVAMARLGVPSCIINHDVVVRQVDVDAPFDDFRTISRVIHAESGYSEAVSDQLLGLWRERAAAVGLRAHVGYLGDEPAGIFTLWPSGAFAFIEDVATHPRFRNRGIGRTLVYKACFFAIVERCEWVLLMADLFDTPRIMYKTLGFEPVGEVRSFLRA
jgi:GNAT superfamily N-acetyltransferase